MPRPKQQIYADLPKDLHDADETLQRYGQWAMGGSGGKSRCGSAEGMYRASGEGAQEARRTPLETMSTEQALRCQRALTALPDRERIVLTILYVPQRLPIEAQLRLLHIPPRVSQQLHLLGIRRFWPRFQLLEQHALDMAERVNPTMAPPRTW